MMTRGTVVSAGRNSAVGTTRYGVRTPVKASLSLPVGVQPASCTSGNETLSPG